MDLDLVEVAPDANPPVCRIMDYNRFKYESAQRAKESRKKATSTSIKEMKYRPKIGTGDFTTKTRQVARFLEEGHKVKVTIMFRGREVSHPELGMKILNDLAEQVSSVAKVEAAPKLDGRNMVMVLAPDRRARQATRRATDLAQETGAPSTEPESGASEPGASEPGALEPAAVVPVGPGAADVVPPASAPADTPSIGTPSIGTPSIGTPSIGTPSIGTPSTGAPSTGAPERVEAPVGSANGAVPTARQPATVAASAPAASRTPEGNLASHSS
jgi:translation initiation factor IF-3